MSVTTTSPLPGFGSPWIQELRLSEKSDHCYAYNIILQAERHAVQQKMEENIMLARVAGYLVLEFHSQSSIFGDAPCATLVNWLTSPPPKDVTIGEREHDIVFKVGKLCRDKFIALFWKFNNPYRAVVEPHIHRSYPSFDALEEMTKEALESTDNDYTASRKKALARDGYRCIITGLVDDNSLSDCAGLQAKLDLTHVSAVAIGTAHILVEPTMLGLNRAVSGDDVVVDENLYPASVVATLERFGLSGFAGAFKNSKSVHQVWNLVSLERNLHEMFDTLDLWFKSTDKPGRYRVCVHSAGDEGFVRRNFVGQDRHVEGAPMVVQFMSRFEQAPPPEPGLLALHATCARVAQMSGAAAFFCHLEWGAGEMTTVTEEMGAFASDGLSCHAVHGVA